jgi:hypothetical protein
MLLLYNPQATGDSHILNSIHQTCTSNRFRILSIAIERQEWSTLILRDQSQKAKETFESQTVDSSYFPPLSDLAYDSRLWGRTALLVTPPRNRWLIAIFEGLSSGGGQSAVCFFHWIVIYIYVEEEHILYLNLLFS